MWMLLVNMGIGDQITRFGTHLLVLAMILLMAWGLRRFYEWAFLLQTSVMVETPLPTVTPTHVVSSFEAPPLDLDAAGIAGVSRQARLHTDLPSQPRQEVISYTVKAGDTLFSIAERFALRPETVLWANQNLLGDDPHNLRPGQVLIILPVDGTYHRWSAGDELAGVAEFFGVSPETILNFPGNHLLNAETSESPTLNIEAGTWLIIPGGRRPFVSWSAPYIPLDNPSIANILGPGACKEIDESFVGGGMFVWPAEHHFLAGLDYHPEVNHPAIDIDGEEGDAVFAVDGGVVVYAGWNNWGFGLMVVINHGNGWQTLYAHLGSVLVQCGQIVHQGDLLGSIGASGNVLRPQLHFEMMFNGQHVNPWSYLP